MLLLANKKRLMGEYVNSKFNNLVAGATALVLILLTIFLVIAALAGKLA